MSRFPRLFLVPGLLALWAVAPAGAQPPETADICFPEEYSVVRTSYFTVESDRLIDYEWFSLPQQQVRNDFELSATQAVRSYEDYLVGVRYIAIYDVDPNTGQQTVSSCSTTLLQEPLVRNCPAFDAIRRADQSLGSVLPVENYVLPSANDPDFLQFDYLVARLGSEMVPLRILTRAVQQRQSLIEYTGYTFEVDPSVFEPPPECTGGAAAESTKSLRDALGDELVEVLSAHPGLRELVE